MAEVIGVRFRDNGKSYYFDPKGERFEKDDFVIVDTARGCEMGQVAQENREASDDEIVKPLREVVRRATAEDKARFEDNLKKEKDAFAVCEQKIAAHGLDMKLVGVECAFDNSKLLFYFTADERIDFRNLVKDLAGHFHMRIELRQIGVRDEAKKLGGLGICGQPFCCKRFLSDFHPVSIKMAKEQGLSLNPVKISGTCGRLMCCLNYEQNVYEELIKLTPKVGASVKTPDGIGTVISSSVLGQKVKVRFDDADTVSEYACTDVKALRKNRDSAEQQAEDDRPKKQEENPQNESGGKAQKTGEKGGSPEGRRSRRKNDRQNRKKDEKNLDE